MYDHERRPDGPERANRPLSSTTPPLCENGWGLVRKYLESRALHYQTAKENGWYPSMRAGDTYLRVVIPATSSIRENRYWQARRIGAVGVRYQSPACRREDAVVLVRTIDTDIPNYSAVVEGPLDALAAAGTGVNAVALMGVTPPSSALDLTATLLRGTICFVIADSDEPAAMVEVLKQLVIRGLDCRLKLPYPAKDLAEMDPASRKRLFTQD